MNSSPHPPPILHRPWVFVLSETFLLIKKFLNRIIDFASILLEIVQRHSNNSVKYFQQSFRDPFEKKWEEVVFKTVSWLVFRVIASSRDKGQAVPVFRTGNSTAEREEEIQEHFICKEAIYHFIYPELSPPAAQPAALGNNFWGTWVPEIVSN